MRVLLSTYHRGGSTLLGEIFNLRNDTFYWYEPLLPLQRIWFGVREKEPDEVFYPEKGNRCTLKRSDRRILIRFSSTASSFFSG